jgi:hypothetical protein
VLKGETLAALAYDRNACYNALKFYELDQGCIYQKLVIRNGVVIAQHKYVALLTNTFNIIADEHRGIKHFGNSPLHLNLYCLTSKGIEKTF